jgi:hypothetical protein
MWKVGLGIIIIIISKEKIILNEEIVIILNVVIIIYNILKIIYIIGVREMEKGIIEIELEKKKNLLKLEFLLNEIIIKLDIINIICNNKKKIKEVIYKIYIYIYINIILLFYKEKILEYNFYKKKLYVIENLYKVKNFYEKFFKYKIFNKYCKNNIYSIKEKK